MKKFTFNPLAVAIFFIVGIAGVSVSHAADIKIGDVITNVEPSAQREFEIVGSNDTCALTEGAQLTIVEMQGEFALFHAKNRTDQFSYCNPFEYILTTTSVLQELKTAKKEQAEKRKKESIDTMLNRLTQKFAAKE